MRYHWGLGVGHLHAHQTLAAPCDKPEMPQAEDTHPDQSPDCITADSEAPSKNHVDARPPPEDGDDSVCDSDCPEFGLDDRQSEGWEDVDSDNELELSEDAEFEGGLDMDDEDEEFTGV
jgi:hypothetical protein